MTPADNHPLRDLHAYVRMLAATGRLFRVLEDPTTPAVLPIAPPATMPPVPTVPANASSILESIATEIRACQACSLCKTRIQAVPGVGNPQARLLLIGEAPGAKEDEKGEPFVGPAGQLLTQALAAAGLRRDEVFIANVLKCRPPQNRDPLPEEIEACRPFLHRQIDALQPQSIAALGRIAAAWLLGRPVPIMRERGTWTTYHGKPLFLSLHPSAVLHNPNNRDLFLQDIAALVAKVNEPNKA